MCCRSGLSRLFHGFTAVIACACRARTYLPVKSQSSNGCWLARRRSWKSIGWDVGCLSQWTNVIWRSTQLVAGAESADDEEAHTAAEWPRARRHSPLEVRLERILRLRCWHELHANDPAKLWMLRLHSDGFRSGPVAQRDGGSVNDLRLRRDWQATGHPSRSGEIDTGVPARDRSLVAQAPG